MNQPIYCRPCGGFCDQDLTKASQVPTFERWARDESKKLHDLRLEDLVEIIYEN